MEVQADKLVPISLDLEVDGKFLKDDFCFSPDESEEHLQEFAAGLCRDMGLPHTFFAVVCDAIQNQIREFKNVQQKIRLKAHTEVERHETISINLRCGQTKIEDEFVWDVYNEGANPERFANQLCADLKLDENISLRIAHKIREEVFKCQKQIIQNDTKNKDKPTASARPNKTSNKKGEIRSVAAMGVERSLPDMLHFETRITHLSQEDAEKLDKEDEEKATKARQAVIEKKIEQLQVKKKAKTSQPAPQVTESQIEAAQLAQSFNPMSTPFSSPIPSHMIAQYASMPTAWHMPQAQGISSALSMQPGAEGDLQNMVISVPGTRGFPSEQALLQQGTLGSSSLLASPADVFGTPLQFPMYMMQ